MPTPVVAATDIQDNECVVMSTDENETALTEDEIAHHFQDASSVEELHNEWLQSNLQALQIKPLCLQTPASVMQIWTCDKRNETFPIKVEDTNVIALYNTGANDSCMSLTFISN